jgi:hypothetical protein
MADIYANLALDYVNDRPPSGWRQVSADLDAYYRSRKAAVESGRFPDLTLSRRLMSDGLYEVADVLLLDIRRYLGDETFLAAAREIYLISDFGRYVLREKRIQDLLLKHASQDDSNDIMALFNRSVWGDNGERYRELEEREAS